MGYLFFCNPTLQISQMLPVKLAFFFGAAIEPQVSPEGTPKTFDPL